MYASFPSVDWMPLTVAVLKIAAITVLIGGGTIAAEMEPVDLAVIEVVAGRSASDSVFVGLRSLDRVCTGFASLRDDWVMELDGDTLVVRYGDRSSLEDRDGCGFGPLLVPQWPGFQTALSAEKFVGTVPAGVSNLRLEFSMRVCEDPIVRPCEPIVVRQVLAEASIETLPRSAARLESGAWRHDPGVGVFGRPGPSLQVREDGNGLGIVWIGGAVDGGSEWVFSGGQLSDAAAALPAYAPIAGGCRVCQFPDIEMTTLDGSLDVWIRSATEIWISLPGTAGLAMSAWRPWAIRSEVRITWLDSLLFPEFGELQREAYMADLAGEWIDIDRQVAVTDGRLTIQDIEVGIESVSYRVFWSDGSGSILCGPDGDCLLVDESNNREIRFRISAVGAEKIYSPQVPCRSLSTCDGQDGGLFLIRGG